ncbi:unannotated protein [freshwater metagenome]|uniref:Unannotated protein n=1 Tax=freshwater metagenome TaxID=449393 RepID=A0A6J7HIR9_9ZZZZ
MKAEDLGRLMGLDDPALPQRLALSKNTGLGFALLATGGGDEHDAMSGSRRQCHGATGGDGFVIGMSVETHEGGHQAIAPSARSAASRSASATPHSESTSSVC